MTAPDAAPYAALDQLATIVAVVRLDGTCVFVNAAFENQLGVSRGAMLRSPLYGWFAEARRLREAIAAIGNDQVATCRFDAELNRRNSSEQLPVHVIASQTDWPTRVLVEMIELEQHARQDREERALGQAQVTRELIRNLAHEIKNPLGGIRGAAQLLQMEVEGRELTDYTRVIIKEADRLQALVDRLLAPHRRPHVVDDVNIHEVCERVRSLIEAEFPRGLEVARDYDASIPEFRGDREQLIQAVLNIVRNAAEALAERISAGDARILLRTRVARQTTIAKRRWRLALELHVQDNGPGIPEAIRDRIFFPLVSGREHGSGLGLTLAQSFVQQHDGVILCDSRPGETTFRIIIPLP